MKYNTGFISAGFCAQGKEIVKRVQKALGGFPESMVFG
jgi:hypothetical protein